MEVHDLPMTALTMSMLAVTGLLVGVIVGMVGIGGVVLAPALILIGGIEPHQATAISLIAFILTGVVSVALHLREGAVPRVLTRDLAVGLLPGAFIGGWLSGRIPDVAILGALSAVCLASALWTTARRRTADAERDRGDHGDRGDLGVAVAGPVGLAVGFGSAVTGTSGPVLLTPVLMMFRLPTWRAIVVGQVIQVLVTPAGTAIGIRGARRLRPPEAFLRDLVTVLLAATGILVAIRLAVAL
jgi:uncharacterized membrane protein YfcA